MTGPTIARRRVLLAAASAAALTACGGSGEDPATATIHEFATDHDAYFVGDSAQLRVRYSGGSGRIEPGVGPVGPTARVDNRCPRSQRQLSPGGRRAGTQRFEKHRAAGQLPQPPSRHRTAADRDHATVALDDGTVLAIGGSRAELNVLSPWIERIDPRTGVIVRAADSPPAVPSLH